MLIAKTNTSEGGCTYPRKTSSSQQSSDVGIDESQIDFSEIP